MSAARMAHATGDELGRFVIDALEAPARTRLEHHLRGCTRCAAALAREAAAESELQALWAQVRRPLAEVVPLPLPLPPRPPVLAPAPVKVAAPATTARAANGSYGALAAAVMALFIGWWADTGGAARAWPTSFRMAAAP